MSNSINSPILIVDDDETFLRVLKQTLINHQLTVVTASTPEEALGLIDREAFGFAILDLNLDGQSGLNLMKELLQLRPDCKVLILTGYASVATAVEAMRLGAMDYLCKPATVADILKSLQPENSDTIAEELKEMSEEEGEDDFQPMSVKRLEWEHIQKVLVEHDGNISATAQALNMHRRTLQRKLQKRPVEK